MSFISFLIHGDCSPIEIHANFTSQLKDIKVTRSEDNRKNIDVDRDRVLLKSPTSVVIMNGPTSLITLDYSFLYKTSEIWARFRSLSGVTRNIASCLTLGCLGCIYWKHLPGQSVFTLFNLVAGIAAAALACIARIAHSRTNLPWSEEINQIISNLNSHISTFRREILDSTGSIYDPLFTVTPHVTLENRAQDFLTDNEIIHLFTKEFSRKKLPTDFFTLYDLYVDRQLTIDSPEARFVNAYTLFRNRIDVIQNNTAPMSVWIEEDIKPSIKNAFSFLNEQDQNLLKLFNVHFMEEMQIDFNSVNYDYFAAFKKVCKTITSKLSASPQEATDYLNTQAVKDFQMHLFTPCFMEHFNDLLINMTKASDSQPDEYSITPKKWLKYLFERISDEKVKKILFKSLDLAPNLLDLDQSSITSSQNSLDETSSSSDEWPSFVRVRHLEESD